MTDKPKKPKSYYYNVAKVLHWVAFFLISFNLLSGWKLGTFPLNQKVILIMIHSSIGLIALCMMLFRWRWRRVNKLYAPPRWWKRPSMILQWIFYPLVTLQVILGVTHTLFIDYDVRAFGVINISAIAEANAQLHGLFFNMHGQLASLLIVLVLLHGAERSRTMFSDDGQQMKMPK